MITELEKQILGAEISSADDWIDNVNNCGLFAEKEEEVIRSRVKVCLLDLRKDWEAVLVERNQYFAPYPEAPAIIPSPLLPQAPAIILLPLKPQAPNTWNLSEQEYLESAGYLAYLESLAEYAQEVDSINLQNETNQNTYSAELAALKLEVESINLQNETNLNIYIAQKYVIDLQFAELVFAQSDYKSQSQKEDDLLPSAEELLQEAKNEKIKELESLYSDAQWIKVKNGHTFMIPLKGEFFNVVVANQVLAAKVNGSASLRAPDIDKNIQTLIDIPYSEWEKFFLVAKRISFSNLILKEDKIVDINACLASSDLSAVDLNIFPEIEQVLIDI
ncbi:MAG: hypothetical protein ACJAY9_000768 [Flavobacteriales bacterium]|jgi:hypothetical protein